MVDASQKHILVLEDDPVLRTSLGSALEHTDICVELAATREDCLDRLSRQGCDLLILALNGRVEANLLLLSALRHRRPPVPSVVLVGRGDIPMAVRAMKAGAADCLETPLERGRLRASIDTTLATIGRLMVHEHLTGIEIEVLRHIAAGRTNRQTAGALGRATRTIEVHRSHIMRKLKVRTSVDLIKRALALGLVQLNRQGVAAGTGAFNASESMGPCRPGELDVTRAGHVPEASRRASSGTYSRGWGPM